MNVKNPELPFSHTLSGDYNISMTVSAVGRSIREKKINWYSSPVDFYTLHYVSEGKGIYSCGDSSFSVKSKDIIVVYPNQPAQLTVEETPYIHYWINIKGIDIENLLSFTDITKECPVFSFIKSKTDFFEKLYLIQGPEPSRQAEMLSKLYSLFAILMSNSENSKTVNSKKYYITKFVDYIRNNYSNNILIDDIAGHVGFSTSQLYRIVSEEFGISPLKFLNEYRIKKSKAYLKKKELKISHIAHLCGFSDPLYFTKVFVKHTGCTPTEYRNR